MAAGLSEKPSIDPSRSDTELFETIRQEFSIPPGIIYLAGNSLGLMSRTAELSLQQAIDTWRDEAVQGWMSPGRDWFGLSQRLAGRIAPFLGADEDEVAVANSTTINLHQVVQTLFTPGPKRRRILIDGNCFPSDRYAMQGLLRQRGLDPDSDLIVVPARSNRLVEEADLIDAMDETVAIAVLPGVVFTTGQRLDMPRLAKAARERGVIIGLDCSHSAGIMPHQLSAWGADFAVWCHYKYCNAGPGAPAGLFLARRWHDKKPAMPGWFGVSKEAQMDMRFEFVQANGAAGLHIGTPPILSMAPLEGAIDVLERAGIDRIRARSLELTRYLRVLAEEELAPRGFTILTPVEDERHGGHIAVSHSQAAQLCAKASGIGIVIDHRPPDILRFAPSPLYNTVQDCKMAVNGIAQLADDVGLETHTEGRA
jgi:kynureninase